MNCKHCGDPIKPAIWPEGPGWTHKDREEQPHLARRCRQLYAEPDRRPAELRPFERTLSDGDGDLG